MMQVRTDGKERSGLRINMNTKKMQLGQIAGNIVVQIIGKTSKMPC